MNKVITGSGLEIRVYNSESLLSLVNSFQAHSSNILRIKPSPFKNDDILFRNYVATSGFEIKIWNVLSATNWQLIQTYSDKSMSSIPMEWLDAFTLASGNGFNGAVKIWSVSTGQTKRTINTTFRSGVDCLKLLSNKLHLAVGGYISARGEIQIYNINDGKLISTLSGHTGAVYDLIQINNENTLASSSGDKTIRIWNLTSNECKFILKGHTDWVVALKQINSQILASLSLSIDNTIKLWNISTGELIRTLASHKNSLAWSLDLLNNKLLSEGGERSTSLLSSSRDKTIKVWNWTTGECLQTIFTDLEIDSLAVVEQQTTKGKFFKLISLRFRNTHGLITVTYHKCQVTNSF